MRHFTLAMTMTLLLVSESQALNYSAWVACIGVPSSYCPLDAGTYPNVLGLQVANNVTIEGMGASPYSTVLVRTGNTPQASMIYVPANNTVTIKKLTIDGNRYSFPNQAGCKFGACGPSGGVGCTVDNWGDNNIRVDGSATIDGVYFWNSADASLYLKAGTLKNSGIYYARSTGAFMESGTAQWTSFDHNGTAGINLLTTGMKTVKNNVFSQNRYEISDGVSGGQVYVNYYAQNSFIYDNTINGYNWKTATGLINGCYPPPTTQAPVGIEVEPYSSNTKIHSNAIVRNPWNGIEAHSVYGLEISGYLKDICGSCYPRYIENNSGLSISGIGNGISAPQATGFPFSSGLTLDRVLSRNNYGLAASIPQGTSGPGWQGNHCLQSSYSTSTVLSQPYPASTTTCP